MLVLFGHQQQIDRCIFWVGIIKSDIGKRDDFVTQQRELELTTRVGERGLELQAHVLKNRDGCGDNVEVTLASRVKLGQGSDVIDGDGLKT
jgi:hypothetical protein